MSEVEDLAATIAKCSVIEDLTATVTKCCVVKVLTVTVNQCVWCWGFNSYSNQVCMFLRI